MSKVLWLFVEKAIFTGFCFLNNDMETERRRVIGFFSLRVVGAWIISFLSGDKIACIFVLNFI